MSDDAQPIDETRKRSSRVDPKLMIQLRIFVAIFAIMTALEIQRIVTQELTLLPIAVGFLAGCAIGVVLVRTKVLGWNATEQRVVGTMDTVGVVILVLYVFIFVINKGEIASHWISNSQEVAAIGLAVTGGVMLGRTVFTILKIQNVIKDAGMNTDRVKGH